MAVVRHAFTTAADGDFAIDSDPDGLAERRGAIAAAPWTWLRQVHGAEVVVVGAPGDHAGAEADAAVTGVPGAALAVQTADCAPVLLWGDGPTGPVIGAAHAGWRGLYEGVLENTV
ncbi:MAG TPA: polyphenol oxidase family protein, partial [Microthrixaceae bacterium]|nr:polyphenol oxidase family protein [Microthrixaceae bacterium]